MFKNKYRHRQKVGGLWDEIGKLQFEFMVDNGLEPDHYLLDVGCGSLRGGLHFIRYLEPSHYFGIDKDQALLDAGRNIELREQQINHKQPTLVRMDNFDFESLSKMFNFAIAQSVFTHLSQNQIIRCIMNIEKALVPGGQFYATYFENRQGKYNLAPIPQFLLRGRQVSTYFDKDPYHYDFETFVHICEGTTLNVNNIGNWGHPRNQKMLVFTKSK